MEYGISDFINKIVQKQKISLTTDLNWIEEPPTFKRFISSGEYRQPEILSDKQYNSVIKVIGEDPKKIFSPERQVSLGILCVGKGGGKDFLISIVMEYIIVVLLHLVNPNKFLEVDGNLDILNVATKGKQAEGVFFSYFTNNIKRNYWLRKYYKIYEQGSVIHNPQNKRGSIKLGKKEATFPNRIRCFAESSRNETWEGYNVIFFVLDEISGFVSEAEAENGWKIFNTADTSCISRSTRSFKGLGFVISYPRKEKDDIILDLYRLSRHHRDWHGTFAFSWHFKPAHKYNGETFEFVNKRFNRFFGIPEEKEVVDKETGETIKIPNDLAVKIPIELKGKFDKDPENALTMFCCLPPRSAGDWIEYPDRVWAMVDPVQKPMFLTNDYEEAIVTQGEVSRYLTKDIEHCTETSKDIRSQYHYVAWLDNAEVACDAVIAIARLEKHMSWREDGTEEEKSICRIVDVINWFPKPNLPINPENVEDFLTTYIPKYLNLREVGADRYESFMLAKKLKSRNIKALRFNLGKTHYDIAKYFIYSGRVKIFDEEKVPLKLYEKELTSLEQLLALVNGKDGKVAKKPNLKKDKADAIVGCINLLLGNEYSSDKKRPNIQKYGELPLPRNMGGNSYSPYSKSNVSKATSNPANFEQNIGQEVKLPLPRKV